MMKSLSKLTLLATLLCGGVSTAWADTTIGTTTKGWSEAGAYTNAYTIPTNKTLTLTFTLTDYSGEWAGYVLNLTKTKAVAFGGDNSYVWFRSCDFASYKLDWNIGPISNMNDFGTATQSERQEFIKGATTVMAIQRLGTQVYVKTTITKNATTYNHYFVQEIGTANDVYAFLCADAAVITISSDAITDTGLVDAVSPVIGAEDNSGVFAASYVTTLEPEGAFNMHFTNYTSGANTWNNWGVELVYYDGSNQYFDLVSGNQNRWGALFEGAKTATFSNINWPTSDDALNTAMSGADVTLTIVRSGRVVTITAVHTPTSGDPFVLKHVLEPKDAFTDFASKNLTVNLLTDGSHATCNYPVQKVNAEVSKYGWSTFSSDYNLDFSGISGLEAFAVTGNEGSAVKTSDALGVVKAGAGVLLMGTAGDASTYYNFPVSTGAAYSGDNLLEAGTGASVGYAEGYTRYVLGVKSDKAVFQKLAEGGSSAIVAKGQAYLQFTGALSAPTLSFDFNGGTTGIADGISKVKNVRNDFYDLQGRKVAQTAKGLYVVNGKIVMVK